MGAMHTGMEEMDNGYERLAYYFRERAKGGVGLIITGGVSPNFSGRLSPKSQQLSFSWDVKKHQLITRAVHEVEDAKICMQILHGGRYSYHPLCCAPSAIKAPISRFKPRQLSRWGIAKTIRDFARCAELAQRAEYDGIEIMGSEGYLINQFIAPKTNHRSDQYGGSIENRLRFPLDIIKAIREKVGEKFIIIFRLSMIDLIDQGSTWEEVVLLAKKLESHGVNLINTGIGWHEARIPTIATMVPRAAFTWITEKLKQELTLPLITTNRINTPELIEEVLASKQADMVCMARPFLADPYFLHKAKNNQADSINTCISCNQGCLDQVFKGKTASCLVNPKACYETDFLTTPKRLKSFGVIGAGPSGLSFAIEAAELGHSVTIFERDSSIGGQFNLAKEIPGKREFKETLRYYMTRLNQLGIKVKLNQTTIENNAIAEFDDIIFATGVRPKKPSIKGVDLPHVLDYQEALWKQKAIGKRVAIIGAGGIGFDTAEFLSHDPKQKDTSIDKQAFYQEWGIDTQYHHRGAIKPVAIETPQKEIYLLQRKTSKMGKSLGKTTGWIHRRSLKNKGVNMLSGVEYQEITSDALHITINGEPKKIMIDNIVLCTGQVSNDEVYLSFKKQYPEKENIHIIGGAHIALEIDAQKAIQDGVKLAHTLSQ